MIKSISIEGFRSFSNKKTIEFSLPDKETNGSGLTVIVGANNSGKTTVIEALQLLKKNTDTIPLSMRNMRNKGEVQIQAELTNGKTYKLITKEEDGAFVRRYINNNEIKKDFNEELEIFILSSKRAISNTFSSNHGNSERKYYGGNISNDFLRDDNNYNNSNFGARLVKAIDNKEKFNIDLQKVLNPLPNWRLENSQGNNLYLEFIDGDIKHSSLGAGDGYINIFNIVDSLYDSDDDE